MKKKRVRKINYKRIVALSVSFLLFNLVIVTYFKSYSEFVTNVQRERSGVRGNVVYVNDAESDYYYYTSMNYTYNANNEIPTTADKNIYNRNNLVEINITYSGTDPVSNRVGYVSTTENQHTYIYYKVLPVNNNGTTTTSDDYVLVELIDNPFAYRPSDYGFNGWITNYRGAQISLNTDYYVRYAKVPITYTNNVPDVINITFNAKWINSKVVRANDYSGSWQNMFNNLDPISFIEMGSSTPIYETDMSSYYEVHYYNSGSYYGEYPQGALDEHLNDMSGQRCSWYCQYYTHAAAQYDPDVDYYEYINGNMQWHNRLIIGYNEDPGVPIGSNVAGYYKKVIVPGNTRANNLYNSNGVLVNDEMCYDTYNGCTYYELQQYYKPDNSANNATATKELYYLVTRDTNIIILNRSLTSVWAQSYSQNKPFTLTGIDNGTQRTNYLNINSTNITLYSDTRIEQIRLYTTTNQATTDPTVSNARRMIYANFFNLKLGRGLTRNGNYISGQAVTVAGSSTSSQGSASSPKKARVIVESGKYNHISASFGTLGSGSSKPTVYLASQLIVGCDYDRVEETNDNLLVYENMNGTFGGKYVEDNDKDFLFDMTFKSGQIGVSRNSYTTGIYGAGRGYSSDTVSGRIKLKIEGGWVYNVIGGPLFASGYSTKNVVNINMTGGEVENIFGGAGLSATYGNRIIAVTGGQVNYSVFGGSNGYSGSDGDGTVNGSTYIYIGGNATIGNSTNVNNNTTIFGAEAGSVFGIGNGKSGSSSIGSCDNSNIVINDNARILRNVYGGGNYGATGVSSSSNTNRTNIKMISGTVSGSIYGGGNNNGSGSSSKTATVDVTIENGTVTGNVYGGSKTLGTVYGNSTVKVTGGTVTNVYGGGEGGYTNNNQKGTYVTGTVNVIIGDTSLSTVPQITKVYGGSAFGTVNGSTNTTTLQTPTTNVTINKGTITDSVFGGGEGNNNFTPYVEGNVTVTVNNGTIANVYGGNDAKGTPNGSITVNINGGTITNVFGGGNLAAVNTDTVNLNGGTVTNVYGGGNLANATTTNVNLRGGTATTIYGGSNQSGTVRTANVTTTSGTASTIYGGNNLGGSTTTANVTIGGGNITTVYGGGNEATTTTTNVNINGSALTTVYGGGNKASTGTTNVNLNSGSVTNVFGGGNEAGVTTGTNVKLQGSTTTTIYGGSNNSGTVAKTTITTSSGSATTIYGGNNAGGTTTESNITTNGATIGTVYGGNNLNGTTTTAKVNINSNVTTVFGGGNKAETGTSTVNINSNVTTVYGGGNEASIGTSNVNLNSGTITTVYGGGNKAGVTTSTNVKLQGSTVTTIYGGSNESGTVAQSNVTTTSGTAATIYGGNNQGGTTTASNIVANGGTLTTVYGGNNLGGTTTTSSVNINTPVTTVYGGGNQAETGTSTVNINSNVTTVFGGGNEASTGTTNVNLNSGTVTDVYGGGNKAGVSVATNVNQIGSTVTSIYGGSNESGTVVQSNIITTGGTTTTIYGGNNQGGTTTTANVTTNGGRITNIYGGGNEADTTYSNVTINSLTGTTTNVYGGGNEASVDDARVHIHNGVNITNVYGGSNQAGTVLNSFIDIPFSSTAPTIGNIYGGNNRGGKTVVANIDIKSGNIGSIYGGGNYATTTTTNTSVRGANVSNTIFGGGNQASVEQSSTLVLNNARVSGNVFGGGNLGTIGTNTYVRVTNSTLNQNLFAGGNGQTAVVYGNTSLSVDGTTRVDRHVFGGGNAAATGTEENNNSQSIVNISGLSCGGNVYGGANTSVLYGTVTMNIGQNAVTDPNHVPGNISITGTVFGGGEANAAGSEIFDFSFISVTTGITINIDASSHNTFEIDGSIFGSGNASSTSGYSNVYIKNYGTESNYKKNVSIQRASSVTLDNSVIELNGTTDRTNEYSDVIFSLSRIDELKLANNSVLYLENATNLVKSFKSVKIVNGVETKETVEIDDDGEVTQNVNNKIYIYEGRNINIATNENITAYGQVSGMAFFGMFNYDRDRNVVTGIYKTEYNNDSDVPSQEFVYLTKGSYVLGLHHLNHNYEQDGFYSNFPDKNTTGKIIVDYVVPTPDDADYYMWVIGEQVTSYEISLTASKYSTLGTYELPLINFSSANTTFTVLGFNYNELNPDVELLDKSLIPRIAASRSDADNKMGLVMKSSDNGWITIGRTTFLTSEDYFTGTTNYLSDNSSTVPTFVFYLYHSKNLDTAGDMGTATISMVAITPIDDLNNDVKRININVNLSRALYTTDDYEGTLTSGKAYEMFAPSTVNITTTSSFTTYYSLFIDRDETIYRPGYHRVLASTYNFPANTKITMIDLLSGSTPEYYYYVVSETDYTEKQQELQTNGDVSYKLSKFMRMGSSNPLNHYDDVAKNALYYDETLHIAEEEFIFIIDFKEAGITEDVLGKSLLLELRNSENEIILSVIGVEQQQLFYNMYYNKDSVIEVDGTMSTNEVYIGHAVGLLVETNFVQQKINSNPIIDTNFNDYRSGIKISILDSNDNVVNGPSIMGISYTIGNNTYYPRFDGTVRINVAERIANVSTNITINTEGSTLASGDYKLLIESFGSPDGIYYGLESSDQEIIPFNVKNTLYGLKVVADENQLIIKKQTGMTENNTNAIAFNLQYSSGLQNPNIRVSLYRRDYDDVYSDIYHLVDFKDYFSNDFTLTSDPKTYMVFDEPTATMSTVFYLKDNLMSGTYKVKFSLYDNDTYIGDVYKFIIIK